MRAIAVGLLVGVLVSCVLNTTTTSAPRVYAQGSESSSSPAWQQRGLMAMPGAAVDGQQLLLLIDPERQTLCSYQIDAKTGQIVLRCVRKVRWDLELDEFNGTEPSPEKIRALLRSR